MMPVDHLHHVGLVVRDLREGLDLFRRLGFRMTQPSFPAFPPAPGEDPVPFGAGNCHATFVRNFVELLTVVTDDHRAPPDASIGVLQVPPEHRAFFEQLLQHTIDKLVACLRRFQGLHILVFDSPDIEAATERLTQLGVANSGVQLAERKIETSEGTKLARVRFVEIESVPEERLALAENPELELLVAQDRMDHPNGAVDLVESVLCVADGELDSVAARYETYLGRAPRAADGTRIFELDGGQVTIVAASRLDALLPGERPPALPAFVAYAVATRDLGAARALLEANGLPVRNAPSGDLFVPASAALGAAVVFRQA